MKNLKKKVLLAAVALSLVAIVSMGTLAWFSDSDEVTNKFMVTDSETNPDKIFSVELYETKVDEDGVPVAPYEKTDANVYDNIAPGDVLTKDPTIENTGKYDQWIRVIVTVDNADAWIAALGNNYDLGTIFGGHDETAWTRYEVGTYDNNTYTMTYYLNSKLAAGEKVVLFETVNIPTELTQEDMVFVGGEFELKIVAQALQYDNTGDNCYDAFANFWN